MWNNHAFTVSTMAHGRGLNAVVLCDFKYQTQILLSKKKRLGTVTRGIVQILLGSLYRVLDQSQIPKPLQRGLSSICPQRGQTVYSEHRELYASLRAYECSVCI